MITTVFNWGCAGRLTRTLVPSAILVWLTVWGMLTDRSNSTKEIDNRPIAKNTDGYISSDNCRQCHEHHYDTWHASHHRTMTQLPTKDSVIADFDDKIVSRAGYDFRFFHKDGQYFMAIKNTAPDSKSNQVPDQTFKIVLSTGAHHQQAFWCETGNGRTLAKIPFIWINAEKRWVPYGSIFFIPKSGLTMHAGMWNSNCIKCHVVGPQPRKDSKSGFDTQVAEFGISCEACHGPGEAHALAHGSDTIEGKSGQQTLGKLDLVNPAKLSHQLSSQTCGQCHSVFEFYDEDSKQDFNREGFAFRPGDKLTDSRHVFQMGQNKDLPIVKQTLERNPKFYQRQFWSDGMVRVSGREYNGLLETACYQRGKMSCLSCHEMHPSENDTRDKPTWADDQLKSKMRGNSACIQCHEEYKSETQLVAHTHHPAGSSGSNCYNCHMPHTTLGLMKAMRSHTIDSPNVATTLETGRPNACNLCHLDKTLAWTSERLSDWYKISPPLLNEEQRQVASSVRWLLKGDAGQRGIVGWHFGWESAQEISGTNWMAPYLAELLNDSYDVVRFIGFHALKKLPDFADVEYDYVGSKQIRQRASKNVIEKWNELTQRPLPSAPLMIGSNQRLMIEEIRAIRKQRKDPPIVLVE